MAWKLYGTLFLGIILLPLVSAQYTPISLNITVYNDGYVKVVHVIEPANYIVSVDVPFLGEHVEGLVILDDKGNALPYKINGSKVTVYFKNTTELMIIYYTPDLTTKKGAIWTLSFSSSVSAQISFPENAIIVDLSDIPLSIKGNSITMPPGNQSISYIIEYRISLSSGNIQSSKDQVATSNSSTVLLNSNSSDSSGHLPFVLVFLAVGVSVGIYGYLTRLNSRKPNMNREEFEKMLEDLELSEDEKKALLYIFERGGKAPQVEVREALGIPKTTAWRMFKRLEKQGLIKIYKKKRENWIELTL